MNRNILTCIQLVASLCNATFMVTTHLVPPAMRAGVECVAADFATSLQGDVVAKAVHASIRCAGSYRRMTCQVAMDSSANMRVSSGGGLHSSGEASPAALECLCWLHSASTPELQGERR